MPSLSHERTGEDAPQSGSRSVSFGEAVHETPVFDWDRLSATEQYAGPAIISGGESTVVVPPEWTMAVDDRGTVMLEAER